MNTEARWTAATPLQRRCDLFFITEAAGRLTENLSSFSFFFCLRPPAVPSPLPTSVPLPLLTMLIYARTLITRNESEADDEARRGHTPVKADRKPNWNQDGFNLPRTAAAQRI